jgi:murein DD-endopeptidase MepM/ murein hydrolase activator NlpD
MKSLIKPLGRSLTLAIMTSTLLDVYALATDASEAPKPVKPTPATTSAAPDAATVSGQATSNTDSEITQVQAEDGIDFLQKQAKTPQPSTPDTQTAEGESSAPATAQSTPAATPQAQPAPPAATPPSPSASAPTPPEASVAAQGEDLSEAEAAAVEQPEGETTAQQTPPASEGEASGLEQLAIAKQSSTQEKTAANATPPPEVATAPDPDIIPTHRIALPDGSRFFRNACTANLPAPKTIPRPVVSTVPLEESDADLANLSLKKQPKLSAGRANSLLKFMQALELEPFQAANPPADTDSLPAVAISDGSMGNLDRQQIQKGEPAATLDRKQTDGKETELLADIGQQLPSLKVATTPTAVTTLPPLPELPTLAQTSLPSVPRLISNPVPLATAAEVNQTPSDQPIAALVDCDGATATLENITPLQWAGMTYPLPFTAPLTSGFGWRVHPISGDRRFHKGIDLAAPMGTPVLAATSGRVVAADNISGYGLTVVIEGAGRRNLYAHLSGMAVRPGTEVKAGTVIGWVGSTGNSTGPHLHFETQVLTGEGWMAVNPLATAALMAQSR